jgi:aminoglycoside/choline kinase family phosphotransferase
MVERESGYFLRAFWQELLQQESSPAVEEEFADIATRAVRAGADTFLHRDFQSRNIMVKEGKVRIIDYQGGRAGPPGYDLSSLLLDPYCGLSGEMREELFHFYIKMAELTGKFDHDKFMRSYSFLAFQRNVQIIGAFSFLSRVHRKTFFIEYIYPALITLDERLEQPIFSQYKNSRQLVKQALAIVEKTKSGTANPKGIRK